MRLKKDLQLFNFAILNLIVQNKTARFVARNIRILWDYIWLDSGDIVGGRTSRVFPTCDELNTPEGYFTIGRNTQKIGQTNHSSVKKLLSTIRNNFTTTSSFSNLLTNLFIIDRGYDQVVSLFDNWFGTLKKGKHCVFIEPTANRPQRFSNQTVIRPEGAQALYQSRVVIEGKRQIQSAFLVSGKATYLTQPATPGIFGENLKGVWDGVRKKTLIHDCNSVQMIFYLLGLAVSAVAKKKMLYGILHAPVGLLLEVPAIWFTPSQSFDSQSIKSIAHCWDSSDLKIIVRLCHAYWPQRRLIASSQKKFSPLPFVLMAEYFQKGITRWPCQRWRRNLLPSSRILHLR